MAERITDGRANPLMDHQVVGMSTYPFVYLSIHASVYLSIYLSTYLSIYRSIDLSTYLSIHLSIHLLIYNHIDFPWLLSEETHEGKQTQWNLARILFSCKRILHNAGATCHLKDMYHGAFNSCSSAKIWLNHWYHLSRPWPSSTFWVKQTLRSLWLDVMKKELLFVWRGQWWKVNQDESVPRSPAVPSASARVLEQLFNAVRSDRWKDLVNNHYIIHFRIWSISSILKV